MLIVTGANGTLGSLVVGRLLARVPADTIGISVRDPDKARALADRGVRVRRGDFEDPESLRDAFAGATDILIISASAVGEVAARRHRAAITAAARAGARRILYTSHMGANPDSEFLPMRAHAATEAMLRDCGVPFVSLRNGFYTSTTTRLLAQAFHTGKLAAPVDGPVSWTDHVDLADAAVIALTEPDRLHGITPPLTAGATHDLADVARIASEVTGTPIERVVVPEAATRAAMIEAHVPEAQADMLLGMYRASHAGEFAAVDPTLTELLGRAPRSVRDVITADRRGT